MNNEKKFVTCLQQMSYLSERLGDLQHKLSDGGFYEAAEHIKNQSYLCLWDSFYRLYTSSGFRFFSKSLFYEAVKHAVELSKKSEYFLGRFPDNQLRKDYILLVGLMNYTGTVLSCNDWSDIMKNGLDK